MLQGGSISFVLWSWGNFYIAEGCFWHGCWELEEWEGFVAFGSKYISAKLCFWSAILFWLITKIKPGLSSTCNWRRVAISSLVYKKSCVERIFQGEDLLRFPARIFNTLKFFYTHWPIHVLSWLKNKNNAFMLTRRYQFCCSRRASRQQTLVTILSKEIKNWIVRHCWNIKRSTTAKYINSCSNKVRIGAN